MIILYIVVDDNVVSSPGSSCTLHIIHWEGSPTACCTGIKRETYKTCESELPPLKLGCQSSKHKHRMELVVVASGLTIRFSCRTLQVQTKVAWSYKTNLQYSCMFSNSVVANCSLVVHRPSRARLTLVAHRTVFHHICIRLKKHLSVFVPLRLL